MSESISSNSLHVSTNMRFAEVRTNGAVGSAIVSVYIDEGEGPGTTLPYMAREDRYRFVRTDQGWRFTSRDWDPLFVRTLTEASP